MNDFGIHTHDILPKKIGKEQLNTSEKENSYIFYKSILSEVNGFIIMIDPAESGIWSLHNFPNFDSYLDIAFLTPLNTGLL